MKLKVFASLHDDISDGWVWLPRKAVKGRKVVRGRTTVKITNLDSGKKVFCEALLIEGNFVSIYNESPKRCRIDKDGSIVISWWYRNRLGISETQQEHEFHVDIANGPCGTIRALREHPQLVVRVSTWLAILSIILGILGLTLGILGFIR